MARSSLTVQTTAASGIVLAAAAAVDGSNGNEFANDGRTFIEVTKGAASSITATFVTNGTYNVGAVAYPISDLAVVLASSTTKAMGPFDKTLFDSASGTVEINWSSGTSVTARVISLGTA